MTGHKHTPKKILTHERVHQEGIQDFGELKPCYKLFSAWSSL